MIYTEDNNATLIIRQENFKAFQLIVIDFKEEKQDCNVDETAVLYCCMADIVEGAAAFPIQALKARQPAI